MVSAAQWRRAVTPLLDDPRAWTHRKTLTYRAPMDWVLLGVVGEGSSLERDRLYVWSVSMPLFQPAEVLDLSHPIRVPHGSAIHRSCDGMIG